MSSPLVTKPRLTVEAEIDAAIASIPTELHESDADDEFPSYVVLAKLHTSPGYIEKRLDEYKKAIAEAQQRDKALERFGSHRISAVDLIQWPLDELKTVRKAVDNVINNIEKGIAGDRAKKPVGHY